MVVFLRSLYKVILIVYVVFLLNRTNSAVIKVFTTVIFEGSGLSTLVKNHEFFHVLEE